MNSGMLIGRKWESLMTAATETVQKQKDGNVDKDVHI